MERILCSAVWVDTKLKFIHSQPSNKPNGFMVCGLRHCDCFMTLSWIPIEVKGEPSNHRHQGFMTSSKRFVGRKEGLEIANMANQIIKKYSPEDMLCSEDLW